MSNIKGSFFRIAEFAGYDTGSEDPLPGMSITVQEAHEFELLDCGILLHRMYLDGIADRHQFVKIFSIECGEDGVYLVNGRRVDRSQDLYLFARTGTEQFMYAMWLKLRRENEDLKEQIATKQSTPESDDSDGDILARSIVWTCECGERNYTDSKVSEPVCSACSARYSWKSGIFVAINGFTRRND